MTPPTLPDELELLRLAARVEMTADQASHFRRLATAELDWRLALGQAASHALEPLLSHHLKGIEGSPQWVRDHLQAEARRMLAENMRMVAELRRLDALFEKAGIETMVVKGPLLAQEAYGNLSLRSFRDLDILVRRRDALRAFELLQRNGFRPAFPVASGWSERYIDRFFELSFVGQDGRTQVDLHWELSDPAYSFSPNEEALWSRARCVPLLGRNVRTISEADTLAYLCLHAAKHDWKRLQWLVDIVEWTRKHPHIDYGRALEASGAQRIVVVTLQLANRLLSLPLPARVQEALENDLPAARLTNELADRILRAPRGGFIPFPWSSPHFRALENARDRWAFVNGNVFLPSVNEWILFPLPSRLAWAYSLIRPFRLSWRSLVRLTGRTGRRLSGRRPR